MVVLTTRLCALNSYEGRPHSWAARSQLGTERSPLAGHRPSAGHRGVSIRGLRKQWSPPAGRAPSIAHAGDSTLWLLAFNWARRGPDLWYSTPGKCTDGSLLVGLVSSPTHGGDPHPGAVHTQLRTQWSPPASTGPQLRTQWSPPMGCAPSIPTKGVPTRGPRALNWAQRGPHSWAMGLQMGMEGFPPRAVRLQLRTQWSPPVGRAPSTAHEGVPTRGQRAFKHTRKDPHSRAAGPQLGTEGSAPAVRVP